MSTGGEAAVPLGRPALPRAEVGQPVTARAWNDVCAGVDQLYAGLDQVGRQYVRVDVTFRGGPAPGARVVGVALSASGQRAGPLVEGVPADGDGTVFHVRAMPTGRWTVHVEAPGFAPQAVAVDFAAVHSVAVELVPTHRFVPDVVGFPIGMAVSCGAWSGFAHGADVDANGNRWDPGTPRGESVLAQGPAPATLVPLELCGPYANPTAPLHVLFSALAVPAWRTIVPNLVGWSRWILDRWDWSPTGLVHGASAVVAGAEAPFRVVGQHPVAGEVVPVGTPVDLTLDHDDGAMMFRAFAGTHRDLAGLRVPKVAAGLDVNKGGPLRGLIPNDIQQVPWAQARRALAPRDVDTMVAFFAAIGAPVGDGADDGLAALWESFHVAVIAGLNPVGT